MRDVVVSGALPRVQLVTPAIVDKTIARYGVRGVLTDDERATLDAFPLERRRRDWLAGRVAAKRALRAEFRRRHDPVPAYGAIAIHNEHDGAPRFTIDEMPSLGEQVNISIAHTEGTAIAAVADTEASGTVGVDIETTRALSLPLISRVLQPAERSRLQTYGVHPAPIVLWTVKEAVLKATHAICSALLDVELGWTDARDVHARVPDGAAAREVLVRHRTLGGFTIAVALCR